MGNVLKRIWDAVSGKARRVLYAASGHTSYYVGRNYVILRLAHMGDDIALKPLRLMSADSDE